jgi:hypothetical protein
MSTAAAAPIPFSIRIGPRLLAGSVVSLGILFWIAVFAQLNYLVPLAQRQFLDYRLGLPRLTEEMIYHSWWIVPAVAAAAFLTCMMLRKRWTWNFALLVLPLLINWLVMFSLFLPMLALIEGLNAARAVAP